MESQQTVSCGSSSRTARPRSGWRKLALCCCAIGAVWLLVLPWMAQRSATRQRIDWLRDRQIDPSAMYYTELDAMRPILRRLNDRQR